MNYFLNVKLMGVYEHEAENYRSIDAGCS
jgi:hypothetical protein